MRKLEMIKILVYFIRCSLKKISEHSNNCSGEIHLQQEVWDFVFGSMSIKAIGMRYVFPMQINQPSSERSHLYNKRPSTTEYVDANFNVGLWISIVFKKDVSRRGGTISSTRRNLPKFLISRKAKDQPQAWVPFFTILFLKSRDSGKFKPWCCWNFECPSEN
jgi:hypothetical protein